MGPTFHDTVSLDLVLSHTTNTMKAFEVILLNEKSTLPTLHDQ